MKAESDLKIGIAGLGVVRSDVSRQILNHADTLAAAANRPIRLVAVNARTKDVDRGFSMDDIDWVDQAVDIAARKDIDVVVEMIGGSEGVALDLARASLTAGKTFVTANKAMLAHHGTELATLAEAHDAPLFFEAAVAGGIPAVKTLREGLAGNRVKRIAGILNG
ncbi:MAG: homoserine dehydrogenase, partial [Candidatus Puniceispirillum sp.]